MLIVDVSEVKLPGEIKQNSLPPECGQPIDRGGIVEPPCQEDTSTLRTPKIRPKFVISIHFAIRTPQLRTAVVSANGVLNRELPLYIFEIRENLVWGKIPLQNL
jgi:hypothetical protein